MSWDYDVEDRATRGWMIMNAIKSSMRCCISDDLMVTVDTFIALGLPESAETVLSAEIDSGGAHEA